MLLESRADLPLDIPKEHTVFRFEIPLPDSSDDTESDAKKVDSKNLVFEIHGSQFENRAPERANRKPKWKSLDYL